MFVARSDPVDGQVLTFGAYFIESAMDGRDRVRTCVIRLFLEDGTVDVCEPKVRLGEGGAREGELTLFFSFGGSPPRPPKPPLCQTATLELDGGQREEQNGVSSPSA